VSPVVYQVVAVLAAGIAPIAAYALARGAAARPVLWLLVAAGLLFSLYWAVRYGIAVPLFATILLSAACPLEAWRQSRRMGGVAK
jgi:hypothetical protein